MSYKEILDSVSDLIQAECRWWTKYLFHFTDINNAVGIIKEDMIYPRTYAMSGGLVKNENASVEVIENTDDYKKNFARLYFRPLTPTQYHSEGYRPPEAMGSLGASCPVPVFFLLNLDRTMNYDGVKFAEKGIAGHISNNIKSGEEDFSKLNFKKIYHNGCYDKDTEADIRNYRQSEVIREGGFPLSILLDGIICRSTAEKETLLYLIKDVVQPEYYNFWVNKIKCFPKHSCFYNSGIYVREVYLREGKLYFEFNSHTTRRGGNDKTVLNVSITLKDFKNGRVSTNEVEIKYKATELLIYSFPSGFVGNVSVRFDNCLMYCNDINTDNELI